jgi:nitrate reductase assembly molybdenum cofactor insertion protein NarJ
MAIVTKRCKKCMKISSILDRIRKVVPKNMSVQTVDLFDDNQEFAMYMDEYTQNLDTLIVSAQK